MSRPAESQAELPLEGRVDGRDDLRELFASSLSTAVGNEDALRHAILHVARTAKAERRGPELVIGSLKRAIIDAAAARISYRAANELTDRVVRWFIDGYYGSDAPAGERGLDIHFRPSARAT